MKKIIYLSFLLSSYSTMLLANEEVHHEASILDLKYPLVNFIIMMAILSKVVKPLREKFNKEAEDVKSLMESAAKNSKDAETKLNEFQHKIKNIDSELVKISSDYELDIAKFAKLQGGETQTTIERMKRDIASKLDGEKKELIDGLNHELLSSVIMKAQETIKSSGDLKSKATSKIMSGLQ